MIDIKIIRENPEMVKANFARRGDQVDIDGLLAVDAEHREVLHKVEALRAERNRLSKECKTNPEAREQVKAMKVELGELEAKCKELDDDIFTRMSWYPNLLSDEVPDGNHDDDNIELRKVGTIPTFDFKPRDHQELGEMLDILDTARGAKVAQSGFYYWKGKGAQLVNALFFWAQNHLINEGFTSFITPSAAKSHTLFGTGYLPFFEDQTYGLEGEDLSLIGTSEQTLIGYHGDEMLKGETLPLMYTAFSPCFRTEAGSYGKAARGIFRVHEFHKVEQVIFCKPEDSPKYHELCLKNEEEILQKLELPYRVVNICVGDMGAPGYKKYDTEAWFAGFESYREVTSNTNLTDFQARRLNIRYKDKDGSKGFCHTISATAVTDRVAIAIIENNQQEDGSIIIPEVLRPLCGFDKIEAPTK